MIRAMLTTVDNPHSPFDEYVAWYNYDVSSGYHTAEYLARMVVTSHELSEYDQQLEIERVIDYIIEENVLGKYRKLTREFPDEL